MNGTGCLFIFGAPRSGTSLLSRMMNSHPEIAVPQESHIYNLFYPLRRRYGDLTKKENQATLIRHIATYGLVRDWSPPADISAAINCLSIPGFKGVADALLRSWAEKQGKSHWGEKTPGHIDYVDAIISHFPNAHLIHIVRDPRDVCLSVIRARFGPKNPYAAAIEWREYLRKIEQVQFQHPDRKMALVRYDDLLIDPESTLKALCGQIGLDFSSRMVDFHLDRHPYNTDSANLANLRRPIISGNREKWRKEFSIDDIAVIEAVVGAAMGTYGYSTFALPPRKISAARRFYMVCDNRIRRVLAMAKNGRGYAEALRMMLLRMKLSIYTPE